MAKPTKQKSQPADQLKDASRGIRLHKALADAGVGSRRACEQLIAEGRVSVNGRTVTEMPAWVDPQQDRIEMDGRPVGGRRPAHSYLMVNKPRRVICTSSDPEGRRTIVELVPHKQRLFCVGRLDADSSGLILLTDDGELANRLTHPRYEVPKTYEVAIAGSITTAEIEKLERGIRLADREGTTSKVRAQQIEVLDKDRERTRMRVTLTEGRNREIRRMMARLGHDVKRLKRISLGPLQLKGIAVGEWRALTPIEVAKLRRAAFGRK